MCRQIGVTFLFVTFTMLASLQYTNAKFTYNFLNYTTHNLHICSSDFRDFSRQIVLESVLKQTSENVCKKFGIRNWNYVGNLTVMPLRMTEILKYENYIPAECAQVSFEARILVPGLLKNFVPHAQVMVDVDVCVRGAHAYHVVYISQCPIFDTIILSHDIQGVANDKSPRTAVVDSKVFVKIPWVLHAVGQSIANDVAEQSLKDLDYLIDSMCFNMTARLHTQFVESASKSIKNKKSSLLGS